LRDIIPGTSLDMRYEKDSFYNSYFMYNLSPSGTGKTAHH